MAVSVAYKYGTKQTYLGLAERNPYALYWCTDTRELYKGDDLYSDGVRFAESYAALPEYTVAADGILYICKDTGNGYVLNETRDGWTQVVYGLDNATVGLNESGLLTVKQIPITSVTGLESRLEDLEQGAALSLTAVNASIVLEPGESGGATIKVGISTDEGNLLNVRENGLFVSTDSVETVAEEAATNAINEFATQASDDGVVNTFKELVDYVAEHAPEAAAMATDLTEVKSQFGSLPEEIMSEITSVSRTETTNTAQIRIAVKQADGTYSTSEKHGVLTLIPAGQGPDGVSGAGLMSLADKQKLDAIDLDALEEISQSLTWGAM